MELFNQLESLSNRMAGQLENIQTEEATKNAFVMPFIQLLGYDVFNPTEVIPEFTADVGKKKGEKVDYAIVDDGQTIMLFECKACNSELTEANAGQLRRYFHVTDARIGILTNGIEYQFYSDLESENVMDDKPFMTFDMLSIDESLVKELQKLSKTTFELDSMLSTANSLKHTREIKNSLQKQLINPSSDFVKLIISEFFTGLKTQQVVEHFTPLINKSFKSLVTDSINERLKSAFSDQQNDQPEEIQEYESESSQDKKGVVTTEEELEGFMIIKAILRCSVDISRVQHRDTKSYFGILLDNNNRKPICRLHFNTSQKYITVFDSERKEVKIPIDSLDEIYNYTDQIRKIIDAYE